MISSKRTAAKSQKGKGTKLRYLLDVSPGYRRIRRGRGYCYVDWAGSRIIEVPKLNRFKALAIPPAWKDVWISPHKNGHLQATGVDEQGRKQYLYHPEWTRERQLKKLERVVAFGNALPRIRRQMAKDLRHDRLDKEKVTAMALEVTEETLIRIGNDHYLRHYGSRGLTTLKKKHVALFENHAVFRFRGKKGVGHEITVRNARLAARLMELSEVKGPYLFQYQAPDGGWYRLRASDVNTYVQAHTGEGFSSKDYRTWYAGFWAFRLFAKLGDYGSEKECEANIASVLDAVSHRLGNTRAVCKQYYVPDAIISAYKTGTLLPYLEKCLSKGRRLPPEKETMRQLLAFLDRATADMP